MNECLSFWQFCQISRQFFWFYNQLAKVCGRSPVKVKSENWKVKSKKGKVKLCARSPVKVKSENWKVKSKKGKVKSCGRSPVKVKSEK